MVDVANVDEGNIIGFKGSKRKVLVVDDKGVVLVVLLEPLIEVVEGRGRKQSAKPDVICMDDAGNGFATRCRQI